jgi:hypothetical protein
MKDWVIFLTGAVIIGAFIVATAIPEIQAYQATTTKKCPPGQKVRWFMSFPSIPHCVPENE